MRACQIASSGVELLQLVAGGAVEDLGRPRGKGKAVAACGLLAQL